MAKTEEVVNCFIEIHLPHQSSGEICDQGLASRDSSPAGSFDI